MDVRYGVTGGNLRPLFADFLDEAGHSGLAPRWREIAEMWHAMGEAIESRAIGRQLAELYEAETYAIARLRTVSTTRRVSPN